MCHDYYHSEAEKYRGNYISNRIRSTDAFLWLVKKKSSTLSGERGLRLISRMSFSLFKEKGKKGEHKVCEVHWSPVPRTLAPSHAQRHLSVPRSIARPPTGSQETRPLHPEAELRRRPASSGLCGGQFSEEEGALSRGLLRGGEGFRGPTVCIAHGVQALPRPP